MTDLAHGLEQRLQKLDRFRRAADDEDELAVFGADLGTGHRRVDPLHSLGRNALGELRRRRRRDGAGVDDDHAFVQRLLHPVGAEHDSLDGGGVGDAHPHDFALLGGVGRRDGGFGAVYMLARSAVPDTDFMSCFDEVGGHGTAHDAETEKGDAHSLLLEPNQ